MRANGTYGRTDNFIRNTAHREGRILSVCLYVDRVRFKASHLIVYTIHKRFNEDLGIVVDLSPQVDRPLPAQLPCNQCLASKHLAATDNCHLDCLPRYR